MSRFEEEIQELVAAEYSFVHEKEAQWAFIFALLVNLLLLLFLKPLERFFLSSGAIIPETVIVYEPKQVEQELEPHFIEANPEAVLADQVDTQNFSSKTQRSAQEKHTDKPAGDLPFLNGSEEQTQKVVRGDLHDPQYAMEELPEINLGQQLTLENLPSSAPEKIPDVLQKEKFAQEGTSFITVKDSSPERNTEKAIPVNRNVMLAGSNLQKSYPRPTARPKVMPRVLAGRVLKTDTQVTRAGAVAIDANFSEFGDYLARLLEAISYQWESFVLRMKIPQTEMQSMVLISFRVDASGQISDPEVLSTDASDAAVLICQDAISSLSPFETWSPEMREKLGKETTIRIRFNYL